MDWLFGSVPTGRLERRAIRTVFEEGGKHEKRSPPIRITLQWLPNINTPRCEQV